MHSVDEVAFAWQTPFHNLHTEIAKQLSGFLLGANMSCEEGTKALASGESAKTMTSEVAKAGYTALKRLPFRLMPRHHEMTWTHVIITDYCIYVYIYTCNLDGMHFLGILIAKNVNSICRVIPTLTHYYSDIYSFWHSIWKYILEYIGYYIHISYRHSTWHSFWHSVWHLFWHSIWHLFWHSLWCGHCPLRSGACGWDPSVPTEICRSQLRS